VFDESNGSKAQQDLHRDKDDDKVEATYPWYQGYYLMNTASGISVVRMGPWARGHKPSVRFASVEYSLIAVRTYKAIADRTGRLCATCPGPMRTTDIPEACHQINILGVPGICRLHLIVVFVHGVDLCAFDPFDSSGTHLAKSGHNIGF